MRESDNDKAEAAAEALRRAAELNGGDKVEAKVNGKSNGAATVGPLAEYADQPLWVAWQLELKKRHKKPDKLPYDPKGSQWAKVDDPKTWGTLEQARAKATTLPKPYGLGGVGIMLAPIDDGTLNKAHLGGVDLDSCRNKETGEIEQWAQEIIDRFAPYSYTEISPSETGVKIIFKYGIPDVQHEKIEKTATVRWGEGDHSPGIELYLEKRYFTVTGLQLGASGLGSAISSKVLRWLLNVIAKRKPKKKNGAKPRAKKSKFTQLNSAALQNLSLWVPDLFDGAKATSDGGYRIPSKLLGRDLEEDLSISPQGIKDFGVHDMGDEREGKRSPIDIVMEYGKKTFAEAVDWLRGKLGLPPIIDPDIDELNNKYAVIRNRATVAIMVDESHVHGEGAFSLLKPEAFHLWLNNKFKFIEGKAGKDDKWVPLSKLWLSHRQRLQYEGLIFAPGRDVPGAYNIFKGFAKLEVKEDGSCALFLAHIKDNVCHGNMVHFIWIIAWMADIFQNPGNKKGTALVIRGKKGTGKTIIGQVLKRLIGHIHYFMATHPRHVTGNFNGHMASLLLLHADEAFWAGDKTSEGVLKDRITGDTQPIEFKGRDIFDVANHMRLLVTGNEEWAVPATFDERRFGIWDISEAHREDHPYFKAMLDELEDGGYAALMSYLMNFDLSQVNLRLIPKTDALLEQQMHTLERDSKLKWLYGILNSGKLPYAYNQPAEACPAELMFDHYVKQSQATGDRHRSIPAMLGRFLNKHIKGITLGDRDYKAYGRDEYGNVYFFPPLDECRADFCKQVGQEFKWGDTDEWLPRPPPKSEKEERERPPPGGEWDIPF